MVRINHGLGKTPEYSVWYDMKRRCYNKNNKSYKYYGGRGIQICDRWLESFLNFYKDMGPRPPKFTIERRDNNKNYEPDNCYWADRKTQANNTSQNRYITYNGETLTVAQWGEKLGLGREIIKDRLRWGWSIEDIMTTPINDFKNKYEYDGKIYTLSELSLKFNISEKILYDRIHKLKWSINDSINVPKYANPTQYIEYNGEKKLAKEWAKKLGISQQLLDYRIKAGWPIERALNAKKQSYKFQDKDND